MSINFKMIRIYPEWNGDLTWMYRIEHIEGKRKIVVETNWRKGLATKDSTVQLDIRVHNLKTYGVIEEKEKI